MPNIGLTQCDRIDAALDQLTTIGALANHVELTRGRPSVRWFAMEAD